MVGQQERKADFFFLSGSDARRNKRKFSLKRARKTLRSFEIARVTDIRILISSVELLDVIELFNSLMSYIYIYVCMYVRMVRNSSVHRH